VLFGSTVQVAHTHASGEIGHADCALCATAHVVAQTVANPSPAPAALVIAPVQQLLLQHPPSRISVFALFTRPPPAASTAS